MTLPSCRAADTCEADARGGIPAAVGVARAVDAGAAASLRASTPPRSEAMPAAVRRGDLGPRGAFGITVPPSSIQSYSLTAKSTPPSIVSGEGRPIWLRVQYCKSLRRRAVRAILEFRS